MSDQPHGDAFRDDRTSERPYVPDSGTEAPLMDRLIEDEPQPEGDVLARRFLRLAAAMFDGFLNLAIVAPFFFFTDYIQRASTGQVGIGEQLLLMLVSVGGYLLIHGYWLVTRGQSVGKRLAGIQIVDHQTGALLPFLRVYVYRYMWMLPISLLVMLIPGPADDNLVNFVAIVDALFIFRADRRCLHDLIAGSKVVVYREGRPHLGGDAPGTADDRFEV